MPERIIPTIIVPPDDHQMGAIEMALWDSIGVNLDVARRIGMPPEQIHSIALSRMTRELRREWGTEAAKVILQSFVNTMDAAAEGDR
jgi:hypothetical protein